MLKIYYIVLAMALADDLVLSGESATLSGEQVFDAVTLSEGANLAVTPYDGTDTTGWLHLVAVSLSVDETSSIDASGAGYRGAVGAAGEGPGGAAGDDFPGGGGYGADGDWGYYGCYSATTRGESSGTPDGDDVDMGSAGGGTAWQAGGAGGGLLRLDLGAAELAGELRADGASASEAGGGAGGGVWVLADELHLSGRVRARGGSGGGPGGYTGGSGGGSGGRIKVFYGALTGELGDLDPGGGDGPCVYHEPQHGTSYSARVDSDRDGDGLRLVDGDLGDRGAPGDGPVDSGDTGESGPKAGGRCSAAGGGSASLVALVLVGLSARRRRA